MSLNRRATVGFASREDAKDEEAAIEADGTDYGATDGGSPKSNSSRPKLTRRATITVSELDTDATHKVRWTIDTQEPTLDERSMIVSLLADMGPAGVLPLANGMVHCGYLPSVTLLVVFGMGCAYMMYLVSRTIEITGQKTYARMWVDVVGPKSAFIPPLIVFSVCFGCSLAYACMYGDLFAGCMPAFGAPWADRTRCLIALGLFPLLPLCMMKDLSALAPTSFGAVIAIFFTLTVMMYRFHDNSYAVGGQFYDPHDVAFPKGSHLMTFSPASLSLVNALAVSFLCHYNGCKYYREYIGHTPGKFKATTSFGFFLLTGLFSIAMLYGYMTFGEDTKSMVLNSYAKHDTPINFARFAMGWANVLSLPLMFSGLRETFIELICFFSPDMTESTEMVSFQNTVSAVLLAAITVMAILITDCTVVVGLVGSICGGATIYVMPCFLFDRATISFGESVCTSSERLVIRLVGCTGVFLMFAGAYVTLATN